MQNPITWESLYFLVAMLAAVIVGVAWTVYQICAVIARHEHRLTVLETRQREGVNDGR